MKSAAVLIAAVLSSFAAADVQVFTDTQCNADRIIQDTVAGRCYNLNAGKHSARGCSVGHSLRVFTGSDCTGTYQQVKPQACANLGTNQIHSILCVN